MALFYLIRHGSTRANSPTHERMRGWSDIALSDEGREQAREAGRFLASKGITKLVASDLKRAEQTTEIILPYCPRATLKFASNLRDWDTGAMEGQLVEAMKPFLDFYQRHPSLQVPQGEAYGDYYTRWRRTFRDLCDYATKNPLETLAACSHARNVVTTYHILAGNPIGPVSYRAVPEPGSIVRVVVEGKRVTTKLVHGSIKGEKQ